MVTRSAHSKRIPKRMGRSRRAAGRAWLDDGGVISLDSVRQTAHGQAGSRAGSGGGNGPDSRCRQGWPGLATGSPAALAHSSNRRS